MSLFPAAQLKAYREAGLWGEVTLPQMFAATAARVPDRLGLVDAPNRAEIYEGTPRRLTYGEMRAEVDRYAALLRAQGLGRGALIATQLPNIAEMILIYLAVSEIGAILSPISFSYRSAELRGLAEVADFDAYISVGATKGRPFYAERLDALPASVRRLGIGSNLPEGVTRLDDAPFPEAFRQAPAEVSPDEIFAVFWTSGTEGIPKAVPKTHNNMMASSLGAWRILGLPDGANILAPFPFVNAAAMGGLMMCWMRTAGALILHHPFDVKVFLEQLKSEEITYTMVSPTVLVYLKDVSDDPALQPALHRLRALSTGSAPPDPAAFAFFEERLDIKVLNFFGSNEGAQLCSSGERVPDSKARARFFPRDGDLHWSENNGRITANGGNFRLVDTETGALVTEPGAVGEMQLQGPAMMPGYYRKGAIDRSCFTADGFFPTADLFEISPCGSLIRFHSRARELIVRGGMKISPVELDGVFSGLKGVREVGVVAYPDEQMGEKVCLVAVLDEGAALDLKSVARYADEVGLAKFKWPERLEIAPFLPRTPLQKLDRKALAAQIREIVLA